MTEAQARAALAAFDGLGGLERWIAAQRSSRRAANRGSRHALTCHLFSGAAMRRQHLYFIIPVLAVIAVLVLFFQRDKVTEGSGAHMPPSGEAARPTERR